MGSLRFFCCALIALALVAGSARADSTLHAGVDVRTDLGTHHARLPLGIRSGHWDGTLVVDPLVVLDGQHDMDLVASYFFGPRIGVLLGWRWTAIKVADGLHNQQRSLVGVTGVGPSFFGDALRTSASLEMATLWVKHGGGSDTDWISMDRDIHDSFSFGMFLRIEYAKGM